MRFVDPLRDPLGPKMPPKIAQVALKAAGNPWLFRLWADQNTTGSTKTAKSPAQARSPRDLSTHPPRFCKLFPAVLFSSPSLAHWRASSLYQRHARRTHRDATFKCWGRIQVCPPLSPLNSAKKNPRDDGDRTNRYGESGPDA